MSDPLPTVEGRARKRQQLHEEVAAYVRGLIISGAVQPGEFIRMEPICEAVGVSNTPVREGLLKLRSEGFLRLVPRRGYVVAPFDRQDVRDLFWVQARLAGELAARAARRIDERELAVLRSINRTHEGAMARGDMEQYSDLGHEFHRVINRAAASERLASLLNTVVKQLPSSFYVGIEGHAESTGGAHYRLVEILGERDTEMARQVMEEHVMSGAAFLIRSLESQGVFAPAERDEASAG